MKYKIAVRKNPLTKTTKFHAASAPPEVVTLKEVARRIEALSSLSRGDIMNVLDNLQRVAAEELGRGNSVRLGLLGTFRTSIQSTGVDAAKDVKPEQIRKVKVVYTPSKEIKERLSISSLSFEKQAIKEQD